MSLRYLSMFFSCYSSTIIMSGYRSSLLSSSFSISGTIHLSASLLLLKVFVSSSASVTLSGSFLTCLTLLFVSSPRRRALLKQSAFHRANRSSRDSTSRLAALNCERPVSGSRSYLTYIASLCNILKFIK